MSSARGAISLLAAFLIAGCGPYIRHPEGGLGSVEQAYGSSGANLAASVSQAPAQSKKVAVFQAPYEDVYRAVVVSTSQSQIHLENESKANGVITGTRVTQAVPPIPRCTYSQEKNGVPLPRKYFYAIVVKERAAKATEVTAAVRVQGTCWTGSCMESVDMAACKRYSTPHWGEDVENPEEDLSRLLTFIRNNLLASGAL